MAQQRMSEADLQKMGLIDNGDGTYSKKKTVKQPRETWYEKKEKEAFKQCDEDRKQIENIIFNTDKTNIGYGGILQTVTTEPLVFKWAAKHISLNAWYGGKHWSERNKTAKEWHNFFKSYLSRPYPKFSQYVITLEYNSKLDPSNTIGMVKMAEDMLQEEGIIENDDTDNCKGIHLVPNFDMKKFSYKLTVKQWNPEI